MKSIKELEAETIKGVGVIAYIKALKDVLELIDEMKLTDKRGFNCGCIKELKARITG